MNEMVIFSVFRTPICLSRDTAKNPAADQLVVPWPAAIISKTMVTLAENLS
jgi:hypothetical protein